MTSAPKRNGGPDRDVMALLAFIESRQVVPHAWGRKANDCVAFVLAAVRAQTGENRGRRLVWSSRGGALRVLKRLGGLGAALDAHFVRIPPAQAMRGDIAGVADPVFGIHPMVVEGEMLVGPGDRGNRRLPRRAMIAAWSATLPRESASEGTDHG